MNPPNPLISIIMPTYNAADFIETALNSIQQQTYKNWELLITDDCSTDNTSIIIKQWQQKDNRIKYLRTPNNEGPAGARNISIKNSKGQYLAFLDSDDEWTPTKLSDQLTFMITNNYAFTTTHAIRQTLHSKRVIKAFSITNYYSLCHDIRVMTSSIMIDQKQVGQLEMKKVYYEDLALWLEIIRRGFLLYCLKKTLTVYNVRHDSMSRNKFMAPVRMWEVVYKTEKNNFIVSLYHLVLYIFSLLKKLLKNKFSIDD